MLAEHLRRQTPGTPPWRQRRVIAAAPTSLFGDLQSLPARRSWTMQRARLSQPLLPTRRAPSTSTRRPHVLPPAGPKSSTVPRIMIRVSYTSMPHIDLPKNQALRTKAKLE
jgi:hypothetical protein